MINLFKKILKRSPFPGQMRLFHYLFFKGYLNTEKYVLTTPLTGNFLINVNTKNLIDASIVYTGDYEPEIKAVFKGIIKPGDTVLDIGANIGFHTLYFSELVGPVGHVLAFEPIPVNYNVLKKNLALNKVKNVSLQTFALGEINEELNIYIDPEPKNPGAYNLFEKTNNNTSIISRVGDEILRELDVNRVDFIKIDVEGYEQFVLKGLVQTISNYKPKIIYEYDKNYQLRTKNHPKLIFEFLYELGYSFFAINQHGLIQFYYSETVKSANILALPISSSH